MSNQIYVDFIKSVFKDDKYIIEDSIMGSNNHPSVVNIHFKRSFITSEFLPDELTLIVDNRKTETELPKVSIIKKEYIHFPVISVVDIDKELNFDILQAYEVLKKELRKENEDPFYNPYREVIEMNNKTDE